MKRVWLSPNYANSILGTEHSIKNLDIKDLQKFHSKHYTTEKICIAIAGNLSEEIYKIVEKSDLSGINKSPNLINLKNKTSLKLEMVESLLSLKI